MLLKIIINTSNIYSPGTRTTLTPFAVVGDLRVFAGVCQAGPQMGAGFTDLNPGEIILVARETAISMKQ